MKISADQRNMFIKYYEEQASEIITDLKIYGRCLLEEIDKHNFKIEMDDQFFKATIERGLSDQLLKIADWYKFLATEMDKVKFNLDNPEES